MLRRWRRRHDFSAELLGGVAALCRTLFRSATGLRSGRGGWVRSPSSSTVSERTERVAEVSTITSRRATGPLISAQRVWLSAEPAVEELMGGRLS